MLPTVGADTIKIVRYSAEVAGRIFGVAAMKNLVPDESRRTSLANAGDIIIAATRALHTAYFARIQYEDLDHRIVFGKGRGVDRGFDALVSVVSESIRTSLPDRSTHNPEYRAVFPHGAEEYTSPTVREDEHIATELRTAIHDSRVPTKAELLALLDGAIPVVGPAATALIEGEKQVNHLFQIELNGRKTVVDTLWEQRKIVETILGRAGKGLARFIFFDFRKADAPDAPATTEPAETSSQEGG